MEAVYLITETAMRVLRVYLITSAALATFALGTLAIMAWRFFGKGDRR